MNIETKSIETKYVDSTKRVASFDPSESTCRKAAERIIAGGARIDTRAVLVQHPEFAQFKSVVLDLAYEEYCQRLDRGESITASQFCERFPEYQKSLNEQLEIHQLMSKDGDLIRYAIETVFPEPGEEYRGYSIVSELGRGAFARVFLATEQALGDRAVAIKLALYGEAEADTLGKLDHSNIVPVYSFSHDEVTGLSLICMPYLGRTTLCDVLDQIKKPSSVKDSNIISDAIRATSSEKVARKRMDSPHNLLRQGTLIDSVLRLALQLSEGLAHAHSAGILHMDLKPSNVLITSDGVPMLLDFNLSLDRKNEKRPLGGTIPYMSPEHLREFSEGNQGPDAVDERSDIFSLGVILYELLSGQVPFGPMPTDVTSKQLAKELYDRRKAGVQSLRQTNSAIDERVASVIDRCIAFDPEKRPQTATELASQLRSELRLVRRVRRWSVSNPLLSLMIGAIPPLLITGAYFVNESRPPLEVRELRRGTAAFQNANFEYALQWLNSSIETNATVDALFLRCKVNLALERHELALADLEDAMERAPDDKRWASFGFDQLAAAEEAFEQARYEAAIKHLKFTIFVDPSSSDAYFLRGRAHARLSDFNSASLDVHQAEEISKDPRMMAFLGYCSNKMKVHTNAIHWYERALKFGFASAELYNNLGFSHLQRGRHATALENLNLAIDLDSNLQPALHNRAMLHYIIAKRDNVPPQQAMVDIKNAIEHGTASGQLFRDAAVIFVLASQFDDQLHKSAVDYLRLSLEHGADAKALRQDPILQKLFSDPDLGDVTEAEDSGHVYEAIRLVNPVFAE